MESENTINTHDLGDLVRCTGAFTDSSDAYVDPDVVKFSYIAPGASAVTLEYGVDAALVKTATGRYRVDVNANLAGTWFYRFFSTGTKQAANESEFVVANSRFD